MKTKEQILDEAKIIDGDIKVNLGKYTQDEVVALLNYLVYQTEQELQAFIAHCVKEECKERGVEISDLPLDRKAYFKGAVDTLETTYKHIYREVFRGNDKKPLGDIDNETLSSLVFKLAQDKRETV